MRANQVFDTVAACSDLKLSRVPANSVEEMLHPYYDNVDANQGLPAEVIEQTPAAIVFAVADPPDWTIVLTERVREHFRVLDVGLLYSVAAADELLRHPPSAILAAQRRRFGSGEG